MGALGLDVANIFHAHGRAWHLIEQFFKKLKQYRSIGTRYDKTAYKLVVAIHLAATVILLN
jgi:transposase